MRNLLTKILRTKTEHDYKTVNIYVDKDDKLIFIPTGISKKWHITTDLNDLSIELIPPYSEIDIESKLLETLKLCYAYEPEDVSYNTVNEKANASKTYNKKIKGKKLISLHWTKAEGYEITPFKKAKVRGYEEIKESSIRLGKTVNEGGLGNAFNDVIKFSEPY
jgi:hypothetical protein